MVVQKNNTEIASYSLEQNICVAISKEGVCDIDGDDYTNKLVIKDHIAYIEDADCPDRICVNSRSISNIGEAIVCLPNKVVVYVE